MKHFCILLTLLTCSVAASAADRWGLDRGTPDLKSAGPLAFGPDDILFVGDTKGAAVFAIATGDKNGDAASVAINIEDFGTAVSDVCGAEATINDLTVNPQTGSVFVSVTVGEESAICRVDGSGKITRLSLDNVWFAKAALPDAPEDRVTGEGRRRRNLRNDAITDIAWQDGRILVSGLRAGDAPSSVREFAFPFADRDHGVGIEIYHAAHGRSEDYAAPRTFVTLMIDGEPNLLAAYVCTPLVKIPLSEISRSAERIRATTVAELGNRNQPLDMISYTKDAEDYLLLSNSARGVMKISTAGLSSNDGLSEPVRGGGTAGQTYENVTSLNGVVQMAKLNDGHAVVLVQAGETVTLQTVPLP